MRRRSRVAGSALALGLAAGVALAEPSATERQRASELFREGRELLAAGDVSAACPKLRASWELDPGGGTLMNLALCETRAGRIAVAYGLFVEARAQAEREGRTERVTEAHARLDELARQLAIVQITIGSQARARGAELSIDGVSARPGEHALEPGKHRVLVQAAGRAPYDREIEARAGTRVDVAVADLEPLVTSRPARRRDAATPRRTREPAAQRATWPVWVAGGVAVVGVGLGTWLGLSARSRKQALDDECPDLQRCTDRGIDLYDEGRRAATGSTVAFAVGGAAVLVGAWLLLDRPPERTTAVARW